MNGLSFDFLWRKLMHDGIGGLSDTNLRELTCSLAELPIDRLRDLPGIMSPQGLSHLKELGLRYGGDATIRIPLSRRARALSEWLYGADSIESVLCVQLLAQALEESGATEEAVHLFGSVLDYCRRTFATESHDLWRAYLELHPHFPEPDATDMLRQAVAIAEVNSCHEDLIYALSILGLRLHKHKNEIEAETVLRRALDICERELTPNLPLTAMTLHNLAGFQTDSGFPELALPLFQRALAIRTKVLGACEETVLTCWNFGAALWDLRRWHDAHQLLQQAHLMTQGLKGQPHREAIEKTLRSFLPDREQNRTLWDKASIEAHDVLAQIHFETGADHTNDVFEICIRTLAAGAELVAQETHSLMDFGPQSARHSILTETACLLARAGREDESLAFVRNGQLGTSEFAWGGAQIYATLIATKRASGEEAAVDALLGEAIAAAESVYLIGRTGNCPALYDLLESLDRFGLADMFDRIGALASPGKAIEAARQAQRDVRDNRIPSSLPLTYEEALTSANGYAAALALIAEAESAFAMNQAEEVDHRLTLAVETVAGIFGTEAKRILDYSEHLRFDAAREVGKRARQLLAVARKQIWADRTLARALEEDDPYTGAAVLIAAAEAGLHTVHSDRT